jgi:hypothetical protein
VIHTITAVGAFLAFVAFISTCAYFIGRRRGIDYADRISYQAGYTAGHGDGYLAGVDHLRRTMAAAARVHGGQAARAFVQAVESGQLRHLDEGQQ